MAAAPQDHVVSGIHAQLDVLEATRNGGTFSVEVPTQTFFTQLSTRVNAADSLLCVGLDPHAADIGDGARNLGVDLSKLTAL